MELMRDDDAEDLCAFGSGFQPWSQIVKLGVVDGDEAGIGYHGLPEIVRFGTVLPVLLAMETGCVKGNCSIYSFSLIFEMVHFLLSYQATKRTAGNRRFRLRYRENSYEE